MVKNELEKALEIVDSEIKKQVFQEEMHLS